MSSKGILAFDWDLKMDNKLKSRPPSETRRVVLVGQDVEGRKEFFHKMLKHCSPGETVESDEVIASSPIEIGLKSFVRRNNKVYFIEIVHIPYSELNSLTAKLMMAKAAAMVFLFDAADGSGESFKQMREIFHELKDLHPDNKFCIALNSEKYELPASPTSFLAGDLGRKRTYTKLKMSQNWAEASNCEFFKVSIPRNEGIVEFNQALVEMIDFED